MLWNPQIRESPTNLFYQARDYESLFTPGQDTKLVHTLSLTQTTSAAASRSVPLLQMKLTPLQPASSEDVKNTYLGGLSEIMRIKIDELMRERKISTIIL